MAKIYGVLIILTLLLAVIIVGLWALLTQPVYTLGSPSETVSIDGTRLKYHVVQLSTVLPPRNDDVDNLNVAASYIYEEFSKSNSNTEYQGYDVWGVEYKNVVSRFGPTSDEMIVIGAHYDSADGLPGADDNASGVAGLLELSRLLKDADLDIAVQLVAFSLEEPPYFRSGDMGSFHYAKSLHDSNANIVLMINLEMIGYFTDAEHSQKYPMPWLSGIYPEVGDFIALVGAYSEIPELRKLKRCMSRFSGLPVVSINAPPFFPGMTLSDHLNFWWFGYSALMITDTAFYRNKAYHTKADLPETLNYKKMAFVVQGVYDYLVTYKR
ncbi:hypothetical protein A9Q99_26085 [Gammaproteobacteria bacterium 45_16_T64]|mgnify:CR=1 FL=1|nr:hypothetical protein A9Q99_26085 [Gammaproteobacteria bacterium 45_16_T64]